MVISLHPHVPGDEAITLSPGKVFSGEERRLLARARGVVVPQSIKPAQYRDVASLCPHVFPDYRYRFGFETKAGNARLFSQKGIPSPRTRIYESPEAFYRDHPWGSGLDIPFPFVVKAGSGGGGNGVFLVDDPDDLDRALGRIGSKPWLSGGFVIQEYVPHGGRDLRVVILFDRFFTYWRVQSRADAFYCNVGRGAKIEHRGDPRKEARAAALAGRLARDARIQCAALDVLFDAKRPDPPALALEINHVFGRKGMGGTARFRSLFREAVTRWTRSLS